MNSSDLDDIFIVESLEDLDMFIQHCIEKVKSLYGYSDSVWVASSKNAWEIFTGEPELKYNKINEGGYWSSKNKVYFTYIPYGANKSIFYPEINFKVPLYKGKTYRKFKIKGQ